MPLPTLACTIGPDGISAPSFAAILADLQERFRTIYGSDAYIAPDSQDGQLIAIVAKMQNDSNQQTIAAYLSYSPTFAQGAGLSSVVKINGITRKVPTFSAAQGLVSGTVGAIITNGQVSDTNGNLWNLPSTVTIPGGGTISVTVTAQIAGNIIAPSGSINRINTPALGWNSFVSTADAVAGQPVEADAQLRQRQAVSSALPSQTPLAGVLAALFAVSGATAAKVYENFTSATDANGLPPHSISAIVGGTATAQDIVNAIGAKKTPGAATYGTSSGTYVDPITGINYTIDYYALAQVSVDVALVGSIKPGYSTLVAAEIKQSIANFINSLPIGNHIEYTRLYLSAYLNGLADSNTYEISSLTICLHSGSPGVIDIPVAFNKVAFADLANISITIT